MDDIPVHGVALTVIVHRREFCDDANENHSSSSETAVIPTTVPVGPR